MNPLKDSRVVVLFAVAVVAAGVGGAAWDRVSDAASAADEGFPVNARGESYGSALGAMSPEQEPDLILAEATNGRIGYVRKSELDSAANGSVSNPVEAIEESRRPDRKPVEVPVYAEDGTTRIGVFLVVPTSGYVVPATLPAP